jgi:hypothetical protein
MYVLYVYKFSALHQSILMNVEFIYLFMQCGTIRFNARYYSKLDCWIAEIKIK